MGGWEETQPGQVTQTGHRYIPDHLTSCSVFQAGHKKEEGGDVWVMAFVYPSHCEA